jgi:exopolysaccharide biosynthesis polyprenyl glycosylphosphotransferase
MTRVARSCARAPSDVSRTIALSIFTSLTWGGFWLIGRPMAMWLVMIAGSVVLAGLLYRIRSSRPALSRILILGRGPLASKLIEELRSASGFNHVTVGIVDDQPPREGLEAETPWLGPLDRLTEIVEATRANHIVVALSDRRGRLPLKPLLTSRVRGVVVEEVLDLCERLTGKVAIEALTPGPLIQSKGFRNSGAPERVARAASVVIAAAGLVFLSPVLALIAAVIKLDSKGPVMFVQARTGRDGRPFNLLKFRTMHPCQERASEWVQDNSDRITRVGGALRRFRLDELPQLVNVLRGEMNLVGPRPHPVCNEEIFERHIAYYSLRSTVHPGVTGWAQVRYGYANNIEEETEKMRYDLYYIKNRSLRLDARILLETVAIILLGHGASQVRSRVPDRPVETTMPADPQPLPPVPAKLDLLSRES